jgi:hypothetical protein
VKSKGWRQVGVIVVGGVPCTVFADGKGCPGPPARAAVSQKRAPQEETMDGSNAYKVQVSTEKEDYSPRLRDSACGKVGWWRFDVCKKQV